MGDSDEELIGNYIQGDDQALKALIDRYTQSLYHFVVRFVGVMHAPDIVQEVFIKVWKNLKKFDISKAHFKTWIFTIARNTITDYLRKKKIPVFSEFDGVDEGESFADSVVDGEDLPDEMLMKLEDTELLTTLLDTLSPDARAVLVLYYQEDMTFKEIGEVLGKPLHTVKSKHRRALEQLRKRVEEQGFDSAPN